MIRKKKICVSCKTDQYIFSKGRCQYCVSKESKRTFSRPKPKKNKKALDSYFERQIQKLMTQGRSEESGEYISMPTRANIAHLLDKSRHPSVADHDSNYVFLTWHEHGRFDQLLFAHRFNDIAKEFPKSWPVILKRLEEVIPACVEKTKLVAALGEYIENQ